MERHLSHPVNVALGKHNHLCAFFHSKDEEYRVLLPFIKAGIEKREKAFHIVDPEQRQDHLHRLQFGGIDVEVARQQNQLEVRGWDEAYLRKGHFDQQAMLALIEEALTSGREQGFPLTRLLAHMEWALENRPGVDQLIEYESRLNYLLAKHKDPVVCVYDYSKFDAGVIMDVLRTHPAVLIGGVLEQNPFFIPPDQFLEEMRQRGSGECFGKAPEQDLRRLRETARDLVALSGIPATWIGREPEKVAESTASMLMYALHLDALHLYVNRPEGEPIEISHSERWPTFAKWLSGDIGSLQTADGMVVQNSFEIPTAQGPLHVVMVPIGLNAEAGWFAVAALRPKFPTDAEMLLLLSAANQILVSYLNSRVIKERENAEKTITILREEVERTSMFEEIVGTSPALKKVISRITKVAPADSTVLITGETGTGKELVARAIHKRSKRSIKPFICVNCAALQPSLIASELFGHEKGAFTGAQQRRIGRFELAEGGTIFLDEVGDLPPETQIALLRVLQEHEFERVGGSQSIPTDVRVIAATNRDLKAATTDGSFRLDLFYRLNVFPIEMPPLRERKEDIPLLVNYFVQKYSAKAGKKIRALDESCLRLLKSYHWPGNIRELQNVIERAVILAEGEIISIDESWLTPDSTHQPIGRLPAQLSDQEKRTIESALRQSRGRIGGPSGAAEKLGIPVSTLHSKIKALKINKNRFLTE
ncbi:MAG TPA: sigma 54-interacting transcriptional regulator [Candidatus Sulfotelmatobacter sp.]|nr:sigma 54-interacting transcriptional regulator [Candidatus Sulfotelmatobacter sp.]